MKSKKWAFSWSFLACAIAPAALMISIAIAKTESGVPPEMGHIHFDFNFWTSVILLTGVPAMAWYLIKSSVKELKASIGKMISCETCLLNQTKCQKKLVETFGEKFAPKQLEGKLEDLKKEKERSHCDIYEEIKANRERVIKEMGALNASVQTVTSNMTKGLEQINQTLLNLMPWRRIKPD